MIYTMEKVAFAYEAAFELLEKEAAAPAQMNRAQAFKMGRRVPRPNVSPSGAGGAWNTLRAGFGHAETASKKLLKRVAT